MSAVGPKQDACWKRRRLLTGACFAALLAACFALLLSARPLLRRILEPDPKHRATIGEIMAHAWIREIEVCTMVEHPRHGHASIRAALGQGVSVVGGDD